MYTDRDNNLFENSKKTDNYKSDVESYYQTTKQKQRDNLSLADSRYRNEPIISYRSNQKYKHSRQEIEEEENKNKLFEKFLSRFRNKPVRETMKDPLVLSALAFMAFICGISIGIAVLVKQSVKNLSVQIIVIFSAYFSKFSQIFASINKAQASIKQENQNKVEPITNNEPKVKSDSNID